MSGTVVPEAVAQLLTACDEVAATDIGLLERDGILDFLNGIETLTRQLPSQFQRGLTRLQAETTPRALGAKTWNEVLRTRWRLSQYEAGRRLGDAADLTPQPTVTGPALDPKMPATAAAQSMGMITAEQVKVLRDTMKAVPKWVDPITRSQVEVELVRVAVGQGFQALKTAAALRLLLLDQDGPEPDDTERRRKRGVRTGEQGRDGMTPLTANFDAEAMAVWEPLFAKFAAPGMCNPADPEPCTSGTPTQTQIDTDDRTLAQRQHDAMIVIGRIALMTDLGHLNGLPVSIIIRTTLQDLESRGIAITGDGTVISMDDVDRLGGHAAYHLCVFDKATGSALNHFRAKRVATPAQRIMAIARDGGCTKPGCPIGPYGCQVHHAVKDFGRGGYTNVDDNSLACPGDNNLVDPDGNGWTTRMSEHHETEWIPPEHLDTGQARTNILHNPDALLTPTDHDADASTDTVDQVDDDTERATDTAADAESVPSPPAPREEPEPPFPTVWYHRSLAEAKAKAKAKAEADGGDSDMRDVDDDEFVIDAVGFIRIPLGTLESIGRGTHARNALARAFGPLCAAKPRRTDTTRPPGGPGPPR